MKNERKWRADGELAEVVRQQSEENLRVYETSATRVDEDAGQEMNLAHGGYGKRQILELVQNGADAMITDPGGRVDVVLTEQYLYCANGGEPIDADGIRALLHAHISRKRDAEIGRFGLGFKSVLGVTDQPEFFCREVSFGFDGDWAAEQIAQVAPGRERYPSLRLARILDPRAAAAEDECLEQLMEAATTVVRLPRDDSSNWLSEDLSGFDSAFMLFSPHVGELVLDDRTCDKRRAIKVSADEDLVTLTEGSESRSWRVFRTELTPSDEAKRDAWELSARDVLPVIWAVPLEGRLNTGKFWAFFPLRDETTLTGIANAPWQINDDRTGLLEGSKLNRELIEELAELVLRSVPYLVKADDPGWVLEVIPARGREPRCWGDGYLTKRFYELAVDRAVIPDQSGVLRPPAELRRPPANASAEALELWARVSTRPSGWCHASALRNATRESRVDRLLEAAGRREESPRAWLEALLPEAPTPAEVAEVVAVAAAFIGPEDDGTFRGRRTAVQQSRILLDSHGTLVDAKPSEIYLPRYAGQTSEFVRLVHADVADAPGLGEALLHIGLGVLTAEVELEAFVRRGLRSSSEETWEHLWSTVRELDDPVAAADILRKGFRTRPLMVRTVSGGFHPLSRTLLPGPIVPIDGSRDAAIALDTDYHREDLEVLRMLGAESAPTEGFPISNDAVFQEYKKECIEKYLDGLPAGSSKPSWDYMEFDRDTHAGPLEPIRHLSLEGRAAFVAELLKVSADFRPWTLKHSTQRHYRPEEFESPLVWAMRRHGAVSTTRGCVEVKRAWAPAMVAWSEVAPVAQVPESATSILNLPAGPDELTTAHWQDAMACVGTATNDVVIASFYVFAALAAVPPPDSIRCRVGDGHSQRSPGEVIATSDRDAFKALRDLEQPCILASTPADAAVLRDRWGLSAEGAHVRQTTDWLEVGPPTTLADTLPTLRSELEAAGVGHLQMVACAEIVETVTTDAGTQRLEKEFDQEGDLILWKADLGLDGALRRLRAEGLLPQDLADEELDELAEGRWKQERRDRLSAIRELPTDEEKLLAAVGEERLRAQLPVGLVDAVAALHGELAPTDIARLTMIVHGDATLVHLKEELRAAGLNPPDQWAGSRGARAFVRDLGFSADYAGTRGVRLAPELTVLGPPDLPPLHDFQQHIVAEIDQLLADGVKNPRGLVSLPTGAGKTRVAVQALALALAEERLASPVLWIAQSEELCEQAVQTWSEVWRAMGSMQELRVGRLWGAANEVEEAVDACQVVVATIDKLRHRVDSDDYEWLAESTAVVIDEAHGATTPEYTRVLTWLGIRQAGRSTTTRAPLIGLTATPFRGTSKEQTERLVGRFGGHRLDRVVGDDGDYPSMYRELQQMGVLSEVDGQDLETGTTIDLETDLTADERSSFEQLSNLPTRVFDQIASDVDRNRLLRDSILERPADWPILVFAVSTEHAHTMAALLSMEGVSAAAIDYRTDTTVRRRYVERFKRGELRVLTNFNVLTQGFDAPAVRAIYVTRPTFSPNTYQQMIGRGLRGPANGGKERCLIVNVRDNWKMYGDRLAFYEFEHLWSPTSQ